MLDPFLNYVKHQKKRKRHDLRCNAVCVSSLKAELFFLSSVSWLSKARGRKEPPTVVALLFIHQIKGLGMQWGERQIQ